MYKLITKDSDLLIAIKELEKEILKEPLLALDTETYQNGPETIYGFSDPFTNAVRLVQIKSRTSQSYVFDIKQLKDLTALKDFLNREDITWVLHHAKFDYKMLSVNLEVNLKKVYCTYVAAAVMGYATGMSARQACGLGLKDLARDLLDIEIDKSEQSNYWGGKLSKAQLQYAAKDVEFIIPLYDKFNKMFIEEYQCQEAVELEMQVLPVVAKMELNGIGFDLDMYKLVQRCAQVTIPKLIKQMCSYFGVKLQTVFDPATKKFETVPAKVNFNSRQDVLNLFASKGIELPDLKAETLLQFEDKHEIVKIYSDYKSLAKQLSVNYEEYIHPITGRIHGTYSQMGTATARFSSSNVNMQQISKVDLEVPENLIDSTWGDLYKDKDGKYHLNYRYCFVAKKGYTIRSIDYSSQELAIMAVESNDKFMINVLNNPQFILDEYGNRKENPEADLYSQIAAKAFGVEVSKARETKHPKLGKKCRDLAKIALLGAAYGKSEHSMPEDLGITVEEGRKLLKDIFSTMPQLEKWLEANAKRAEKTRLSKSALNRLRFLNDSKHTDKGAIGRAGRNTPIQCCAALMMKKAMVYLDQMLPQIPTSLLIGTVHDEVLVEMPDDLNAPEDLLQDEYGYLEPKHRLGAKLVLEAMYKGSRFFLKGVVPDKATCGVGRTWTK